MNFDPRGFMNGMYPPFFGPPTQPINPVDLAKQQPPPPNLNQYPYNVLNSPFKPGVQIAKEKVYGYGALPYAFYNKSLKNPSKEELEEEYKKIMGSHTQDHKKQQEQEKQKQEQAKNDQEKQSSGGGSSKKKSNAMISFDKLSAGTVSSSSGIFNGRNIQFGWSSHSKTNNGFGTMGGNHNTMHNNLNIVFDNDQLDTPIDDRDIMWSPVPNSSV